MIRLHRVPVRRRTAAADDPFTREGAKRGWSCRISYRWYSRARCCLDSREPVVSALAERFKLTEEKAAALVSGRETVVKRNVPASDGGRFIQVLEQAGARTRLDPGAEPPPAAAAPPPAATAPSPQERSVFVVPEPSHPATPAADQTECPDCGAMQPLAVLCRNCGCHMPSMRAKIAARLAEREALTHSSRDCRPEKTPTPSGFGLSMAGRIGRLRYLAFCIPPVILLFALGIPLIFISKQITGIWANTLFVAPLVLYFWMWLRLLVLRLHDVNRSGWWFFGMLFLLALAQAVASSRLGMAVQFARGAPLVAMALLAMWPGTRGENDFGPPSGPNTGWVYAGVALFALGLLISLLGLSQYPKAFPLNGRFASLASHSAANAGAAAPAGASGGAAEAQDDTPLDEAARSAIRPRHGGPMFSGNGFDYEVISLIGAVSVYVTRDGLPVNMEDASGTVVWRNVRTGMARTLRLKLSPDAENELAATSSSGFEPNDILEVRVRPKGWRGTKMSVRAIDATP